MKLGIAIPALDDEDNIESIIQRSPAARPSIQDRSHDSDSMHISYKRVGASKIDMIGNVLHLLWVIVETGFLARLIRPLNVVLERGLYRQQLRRP